MRRWLVALVWSMALLAGCRAVPAVPPPQPPANPGQAVIVKVGTKNFTEQALLGRMTVILLREHGFDGREFSKMNSSYLREALINGQLDLYWEYTGTALTYHHGQPPISDRPEAYAAVRALDGKQGLVWLEPAGFSNSWTVMMRREDAAARGIESMSDLAAYINAHPDAVAFGTNDEFAFRPDGYPGLERTYGFRFPPEKVVKMDSGMVYQALRDGYLDATMGFATDPRIQAFDLVNLVDDKGFFSDYSAAPVIRQKLLEQVPELGDLLNSLSRKLDHETMVRLNYLVDVEKQDVAEVARRFLQDSGLVP